MNEEAYQEASGICLAVCRINIFAGMIPLFNKPETRLINKQFLDLILTDSMLAPEFLNDVRKPDEASDSQDTLSEI